MNIHQIELDELNAALSVIQNSFATVAAEFHLTEENCPGHTAFITLEKLQRRYAFGDCMYLCTIDSVPVGFYSLKQIDSEAWELDHLSVLPEYRHHGIGEALLDHAEKTVQKKNGITLKIGIIEDNTKLKKWYIKHGFVSTGTKRFEHLPFTVGFMEKRIEQ